MHSNPLNAFCFKPFKISFKKRKNAIMVKSKFNELDKIIFVRWVGRSLNQSLIKQTIKVGFRVIRIWPFNPKIMDEKKIANP
jgi:hypothetical protein